MEKQPKILYIDDTATARALVARVLTTAGYLVLEASSPLLGIELARDTQPDLVLIDINMPEMSGREVAARLRKVIPSSILVAFTADVSAEARERALAAGCVGYLTKPLDVDLFAGQVQEYLDGKREELPNPEQARQALLEEIVEDLETKVRQLTRTAEHNAFLNQQNQRLISWLQRRQQMLEAAARVSALVTSILDLDRLLQVTAQAVAREYGLYFVAIYLLDDARQNIVLRAGSGELGARLLAESASLPLNDQTNLGHTILGNTPGLVSQTEIAPSDSIMSVLTGSRSRLALPLSIQGTVFGALSVHADQPEGFAEDDVTALETLANQVAVAIHNARTLQRLDQANRELLRTKTFEAIANATGETIHWVGNKAAPIPASAQRIREDLHTLQSNVESSAFRAGLNSMLEDLDIIEQSAAAILDVKEDFLGPVRLPQVREFDINALLRQVIFQMNLPQGVVQTGLAEGLPPVHGDPRQLGQVFNNLIKNAWEALNHTPDPQISVSTSLDTDPAFLRVQVSDNGPGIPPEILDKIWISFFTTKGERGGTGLGLSACLNMINQAGGRISALSQPGQGATFTVMLPVTNTQ